MRFNPGVPHIDSLAKYAAAFFNISFSTLNLATSCRSRVTSASRSLAGCLADPLAGGCPLRARNTQFASVFADISSDRATVGMPRPPSVHTFVVLVGSNLHRGVIEAIQYGKSLRPDHMTALHISDDLEEHDSVVVHRGHSNAESVLNAGVSQLIDFYGSDQLALCSGRQFGCVLGLNARTKSSFWQSEQRLRPTL